MNFIHTLVELIGWLTIGGIFLTVVVLIIMQQIDLKESNRESEYLDR